MGTFYQYHGPFLHHVEDAKQLFVAIKHSVFYNLAISLDSVGFSLFNLFCFWLLVDRAHGK